LVDQPPWWFDRIDVAINCVGAALAHRRRHHDVPALALDLDAVRQGALAAAKAQLGVPPENQVRAVGGAAVLARAQWLVLRNNFAPGLEAVGVVLRGVDIERPDAGALAHW
jgi:hypothetical protein